ncbi:periplasmic or secreted lipoprotein [Herbaspirillum frisingense GSF30]|uniref:Periplasmic or secreted lipoprotein n=1 Tax=Herbaspirillum frisingense GSF30 TaxID=864073 RepID=A0AAI9IGP6_9BURK|nr:BON domain-containing protein [Herbaspirillum frisingense]EOA05817.1 periplasmic or secreted lipoprotein [Herbaspirillum frisingense GSF30]
MSSDTELQQKIIDELDWEPSVNSHHINVAVKDGIATLSGYVTRFSDKKAAEQSAKRVANVKAVVDELQVKLDGSSKRSDLEIAEVALTALRANATLPRDKVTVTVADGWVTLDGKVDWHYQHDAAESSVRNLVGVKDVVNKIEIKPSMRVADVKSKIYQALVRNAQIDASKIDVVIDHGVATLSGKVKSWAEKEQAGVAAWSAPGVTIVKNNIAV